MGAIRRLSGPQSPQQGPGSHRMAAWRRAAPPRAFQGPAGPLVLGKREGGSRRPKGSRRHPSLQNGASHELLSQWDTQLNPLTPDAVSMGSSFNAHWTCLGCPKCGRKHSWQAQVCRRALAGAGCPYCAGQRACACSSIVATHPQLVQEYDTTRNKVPPSTLSAGSGSRDIWWRCRECQHSWQTSVKLRAGGTQTGCPACSARARSGPRTGQPLLQDARPDLAAQLHPDLNPPDQAADVTLGSSRKLWWRCQCRNCSQEHAWQAEVQARVVLGCGCPICAGRQPCACNSLAAKHPDVVAAEWDPANAPVSPEQLLPGSSVPVMWRCMRHEPPFHWVATPHNRTGRFSSGCPKCFNARRGRAKVTVSGTEATE